jgi:autotransporter-associated beta strand protein
MIFPRSALRLTILTALAVLMTNAAFAGSATWKSSPATGDWNTATNWTPQTVPNGPSDVATFATSNQTAVSVSAQTEVNGITFDSGASAFTIAVPPPTSGFGLIMTGVGITNNSGITQKIVTDHGTIRFFNSASAGSSTSYAMTNVAQMQFNDASTAGSGTFTLSTGSSIFFTLKSSAGAATFIANPSSNGGYVVFERGSTGGTSRVELFGSGTGDINDGHLAISNNHHAPGVTIGSLEGTGSVFLGAKRLTVGSNGLSTTFSGVIADCPAIDPTCNSTGAFGSLTKIGKGKLTLSHSTGNTYTGGTTVANGRLLVKNTTGSATGSGPVQVNRGTLDGTGKISGTVTIGTAGGSRQAVLTGTLTITNTLTFNSPAIYKATLNRTSSPPKMSKVSALGVTINSGATFRLVDRTTGTLTAGTSFTVINNTSANPIFGTFGNLADGGTITSGGTTFKANYYGGNGNDLTLTVQ